jgi:hypothetical protein
MLSYFPEIYPGELLYSLLSRLRCHSGILSPKLMLDFAFNYRNGRAGVFLQPNVGRLAANIHSSLELTAQKLVRDTTLLPYLTAYQSDKLRTWALELLSGDKRDAGKLHVRLGLVAGEVRLPTALRYCVSCRAEMLREHGELYWRRDHQLPGVLVCPKHGTLVADSTVNLTTLSPNEFVFADEDNCPSSPALPDWMARPETVNLLLKIAKASSALLSDPPPARDFIGWGDEIQLALRSRGFDRGNAQIDQLALRDAYLAVFHPVLDILPDAKPGDWLEAIGRKHRKAFAPLRHILIRLFLESLPLANVSIPFGTGPWPCRNPLAEHRGQSVIADCRLHMEAGKVIGVFRCSCGYSFSTAPGESSRAKILNLGSIFEERLRGLVSSGSSLRGIAHELHVDPKTVLRYVALLRLKTPWKGRPARNRKSLIEREEMRAAWTGGRAAAPDLTRQQIRRRIPAVYAWLYRNDRDWLNLQLPSASRHKPNKPLLDWRTIDLETEQKLRQGAAQLLKITPPQQITRLALERALGRPGWVEKRLRKLPRCAAALSEVTESVEEFQCRRAIWAAQELRAQDLPIQVWRLRRLAGLADQCTEKVERLLIDTADQIQPEMDNHSADTVPPDVRL